MPRPIETTVVARETRAGADIADVTYPAGDGSPVQAYLVQPAGDRGAGPGPGLLAWHWLDTEAPDGDRTQFVDEAVGLAGRGVTSLLPQGRFPWSIPPSSAAADTVEIEAEVDRLRRGLDLLAAIPGVDATRLAVVGHDFGGMLATIAAARESRLRALVIIAATPRWGDWCLPFWPITDDRIEYLRAMRPLDPIEHIAAAAPARVLFQFARADFYIAPMSGLEFQRAAGAAAESRAYDDDHAMRRPEVRVDRLAFLARELGLDVG